MRRDLFNALENTPNPTAITAAATTIDSPLVVQPVLKDIFGDTVPLGDKIYAIRAPAPTSSSEILVAAERRTVGIVFNWRRQVGFNRVRSCFVPR